MTDEPPAGNGTCLRPARPPRPVDAERAGPFTVDELADFPGLHRLVAEFDQLPPTGHLERLVAVARAEVEGASWVTITVADEEGLVTRAWTDRLARLIDRAQLDADDGPIVTIPAHPGAVVHSCDLVADRRWPRFSPRAHQLGVGAALCQRLGRRSRPAGVLSVYADRPHAFSADSDRVARLLALYAGIALDTEAVQRGFRSAARSGDLIGQAKGMLMERLHLPPDQAFATLVARSTANHSPIQDVARHLVATGELP